MKDIEKGIVTLCRASITGQSLELPDGFDLAEALALIRRHNIISLAYDGALRCGIAKDTPLMRELFREYCRIFIHSENQMKELNRVLSVFEQRGIDYIPLKGCRHKAIYPKHELRPMGDADVLVRNSGGTFDTKAMEALMAELGYSFHSEEDNVLGMECPALFIELHENLFASEYTDLCACFSDTWSKALHNGGHSYAMTREDEYLYIFAHFAKHFRDSGIGLRHVLDLWVYRRTYTDMDWEYIYSGLDKLQLRRFHDNILCLISYWFEDAPVDPMAEYLSAFVFSSGSWGRLETSVLNELLRSNGGETENNFKTRMGYLLYRAFPPVKFLINQCPILRKAPWLLPFVWIYRIFYKLLFQTKRVVTRGRAISSADAQYLAQRAKELDYVGLNINF